MINIKLHDDITKSKHLIKDYCAFIVRAYDDNDRKVYFIGKVADSDPDSYVIIDMPGNWRSSIFTGFKTIEEFIEEWYEGQGQLIRAFKNSDDYTVSFTEK